MNTQRILITGAKGMLGARWFGVGLTPIRSLPRVVRNSTSRMPTHAQAACP